MAGTTSGLVLRGRTFRYVNEDATVLGEGTFGSVWKYKTRETGKEVAIKVVNSTCKRELLAEVKNLSRVRKLDSDKNNLVTFIESFRYNNFYYLVYEMLEMSLQDFMEQRDFQPLKVREIRVIAQQMFVALDALRSVHVVHGDIKPTNIMCVNHKLQPFRVKIIDFGTPPNTSNLVEERARESLLYRAPEVLISHPSCHEPMDMWSLSCVLLYLFLGEHFFCCSTEYGALMQMRQLFGIPENNFLDAGERSNIFYTKNEYNNHMFWNLKVQEQYTEDTGVEIDFDSEDSFRHYSISNILVLQRIRNENSLLEYFEAEQLVDINEQMLVMNPDSRMTPFQALSHNLITMNHLAEYSDSRYVITAKQMMAMCPVEEYEDEVEEEKRYFDFLWGTESYGTNVEEEDSPHENEVINDTEDETVSSESSDGRDCDEEGRSSENEVIIDSEDKQDSSETFDVIKRKEVISGPINVKMLDVNTGSFEAGTTQEEVTPKLRVRVTKLQQKELHVQFTGKLKIMVKKLIKSRFPAETASSTWRTMKLPGEVMGSSDIAAAVYKDRPAGKNINTTVAGSNSKTEEFSGENNKRSGFCQTFMKCFQWIGKFFRWII